ncbi:DUF3105 domain-containing protein [Nocardioides sp.]|uniref:DUF3105 domain-containing protein n=1 Tax=Nocardioides sp. TaxID=35761 RepID=UPI002611680C|nr:DUF3105 domain-containing protein [Nocardioides sp.]
MQDQPHEPSETPQYADSTGLEILGIVEPERRRRPVVILVAVLAVALLLAGGAAWPLLRDDAPSAAPGGSPSAGASGGASGDALGITGLRSYSHLGSAHVTGPVAYPQSPPVGGEHDPVWLACGAYDVPVRNENAVHDLEHGAVWIAYRPSLGSADVAALTKRLPRNGIMAPYPDLRSAVVLTVWGFQLALDSVDDPRITQFLARFGQGQAAPEAGVSCVGGTTDPTGGGAPSGGSTEEPGTAV